MKILHGKCSRKPILAPLLFCISSAVVGAQDVPREFTPDRGFAGRSEGHGTLRFLFGRERPFRVESVGTRQADGSIVLDQKVYFEGEPTTARQWSIRSAGGGGKYVFTLSDAAGPGEALVQGQRLELRYPIKRGGIEMYQVLDLSGDGKRIANKGRICIWGIPIGWLQETIERLP